MVSSSEASSIRYGLTLIDKIICISDNIVKFIPLSPYSWELFIAGAFSFTLLELLSRYVSFFRQFLLSRGVSTFSAVNVLIIQVERLEWGFFCRRLKA